MNDDARIAFNNWFDQQNSEGTTLASMMTNTQRTVAENAWAAAWAVASIHQAQRQADHRKLFGAGEQPSVAPQPAQVPLTDTQLLKSYTSKTGRVIEGSERLKFLASVRLVEVAYGIR